MPFEVTTMVERRREFVLAATQEDANVRRLCRVFGISAQTGYRWLRRYHADGLAGLEDRSCRPGTSPRQTVAVTAAAVVAVREAHPTWGGRKVCRWLREQGAVVPPAPSTITGILRRHGALAPQPTRPQRYARFEQAAPNALWPLDFMGHHPLRRGRVHPLTVLDDHSRFGIGLVACAHQHGLLVQHHLTTCFQRYGLPEAILADNGGPWGRSYPGAITRLEAWLLRLGIRVIHGRPYHPQTQGKVERWHRTIGTDVFQFGRFPDLATAQDALDRFRTSYNTDRPHEALDLAVPASRYQPSTRPLPATLPEIVYGPDDQVRFVTASGAIRLQGRTIHVGQGVRGLPVGIRPTAQDGVFTVRFCPRVIRLIDLRAAT